MAVDEHSEVFADLFQRAELVVKFDFYAVAGLRDLSNRRSRVVVDLGAIQHGDAVADGLIALRILDGDSFSPSNGLANVGVANLGQFKQGALDCDLGALSRSRLDFLNP